MQSKNFEVLLKEELAIAEPNLTLTAEQVENPQQTFTLETTKKVINLLNVLPNGVIRNSDVIKKRGGKLVEHWCIKTP